jgi:molecular chaperone DnaK (HSP70)
MSILSRIKAMFLKETRPAAADQSPRHAKEEPEKRSHKKRRKKKKDKYIIALSRETGWSYKEAKERIDKINNADALCFQAEKFLKDNGDKVPADVKSQVESSVASLKEAIKNQNMADIETYSAAVNKAFEQMYQAQQAAGQQGPQNPYGNGPQGGPQGPQDQGPDEQ